MSVDLGTQIRDYAQAVDAAQEPLSRDEIMELRGHDLMVVDLGQPDEAGRSGDTSAPHPVGRWLGVATVAAAAIVAVAGLVLVADGPGGDVVTGAVVADPTSSPAVTPNGPPTPPVFPNGTSDRIVVSPIVELHDLLVAGAGIELFSVAVLPENDRDYWRLMALNVFDGQIWGANSTYRPIDQQLSSTFDESVPTRSLVQTVTITKLDSVFLPVAYELREVIDDGGIAVSYDVESGTLIVPRGTDGASAVGTYTVLSAVPIIRTARLNRASTAALDADFLDDYTALPAVFPAPIRAEAGRITAEATTDYERALALQNHFRDGFTYNSGTTGGHSVVGMEKFLFRVREGQSEQFAGAFAVLARSIGLPTRVAVGFTWGEWDASRGEYVVRGEHAHAWPEVFFAGTGWVRFEPTPGYELDR